MQIAVRHTTKGWCKSSKGAKYSDVSLRVFRAWFKDGLRYVRLENGRILTKYDWIDSYLGQFEVKDEAKLTAEALVESMR
jgi:predicted site-specific integrase-resolvase